MKKPEEVKVAIGVHLTKLRLERGLTRPELSKRTGGQLSQSRINNYKRGDREVGAWEAEVLADALGVTAAEILCLRAANSGVVASSGLALTDKRERELIQSYRALPDEKQAEYSDRLRELAVAYNSRSRRLKA